MALVGAGQWGRWTQTGWRGGVGPEAPRGGGNDRGGFTGHGGGAEREAECTGKGQVDKLSTQEQWEWGKQASRAGVGAKGGAVGARGGRAESWGNPPPHPVQLRLLQTGKADIASRSCQIGYLCLR